MKKEYRISEKGAIGIFNMLSELHGLKKIVYRAINYSTNPQPWICKFKDVVVLNRGGGSEFLEPGYQNYLKPLISYQFYLAKLKKSVSNFKPYLLRVKP